MQQNNDQNLCWGKIAACTETQEQNALLTDKLLDAIRRVENTEHKQYEIVKEIQAMKLVPYLEQRLRRIEAQQQREAS